MDPRQGKPEREAINLELHRWKRCEDTLLGKLVNFARSTATGPGLSFALEQFWGADGLASQGFNDEASFARFFDWFVFDYRRNRRSRRMVERFRDTHGKRLPPEERQLLEAWLDVRLGIYEVAVLEPGRALTLVDIFNGQRFVVVEKSASRSLHKYDLLLARVLPVFDTYGLSTAGLVIPRAWKPVMEVWVAENLEHFQRDNPGAGWNDFFRGRAQQLNRFLVGMLLDPPMPRLRTSTGEDLVFCRACYDVADAEEAAGALASLAEVVLDSEQRDRSGRLARSVWTWQGTPARATAVPLPGGLVLGTVRLENGRLWLECMSRERLAAGKRMLTRVLDGRVRHRFDDYRGRTCRRGGLGSGGSLSDVAEVFGLLPSDGRRCTRRPAGTDARDEAVPPVVNEALQRFMNDYYARWVDQPVPALGGRTPRDACRSIDGRTQVVELLKFIENMEEKKRRAGEPYFEVNRLRRELGLPEE